MVAFPASLLILNGKSVDNLPLCDAIAKLRDEGMEVHVRATWKKDDAQRYADEARQLSVETAIAGGDGGTINEVSTVLIQPQSGNIPALGILPLGTASDFAASADILDDLDRALRLTITANTIKVDMVQVSDKACFINVATGGFGTCITIETPEKLRAALGGVSYFVHGLMCIDAPKPDVCDICGEDFHWQGKALTTGIGNGRQAGGRQRLCSTAPINNDLLQLRILTGEELLPGLLSALTQSEDNPNIIDGAPSRPGIRAPHEIIFNLDGEPLSEQKFHTEILPAALRHGLPPSCPLLR